MLKYSSSTYCFHPLLMPDSLCPLPPNASLSHLLCLLSLFCSAGQSHCKSRRTEAVEPRDFVFNPSLVSKPCSLEGG